MDLGSILCRVDSQKYLTVGHFMADFGLISRAAKAYWEDDPQVRSHEHRSGALYASSCFAVAIFSSLLQAHIIP